MSEKKKGKYIGENNPNWNKPLSEEHKRKISKKRNTSGIMHVDKHKCKECKQGFIWRYMYYDENKKQKEIARVNLGNLEREVKKRGLEWIILDSDKYTIIK